MGAAKLSPSPRKGHAEDTAKKQRAGSVEARINNDRAPHCETQGWVCYWSENNHQTAKRRNNNRDMDVRSLHACGKVLGLEKFSWMEDTRSSTAEKTRNSSMGLHSLYGKKL